MEEFVEVEQALISNCHLLGYDGSKNGIELDRGMFRHSNPKGGEALLYFLFKTLRPVQTLQDFQGIWPIFDSRQSRDFRRIVHGLLMDLETSGNLPKSNSRLSSLATCCGARFVELMWQLSAHVLQEVYKRSNYTEALPWSASDNSNQASDELLLLKTLKARIALERRCFLETSKVAVKRKAHWKSVASDSTTESRAASAEQALLKHRLQELHQLGLPGGAAANNLNSQDVDVSKRPASIASVNREWESLATAAEQTWAFSARYSKDGEVVLKSAALLLGRGGEGKGQDSTGVSVTAVIQRWTQGLQALQQSLKPAVSEDCTSSPLASLSHLVLLLAWGLPPGLPGPSRACAQGQGITLTASGVGVQLQDVQGQSQSLLQSEDGSHVVALEAALARHRSQLAFLQALAQGLQKEVVEMDDSLRALRKEVLAGNQILPTTPKAAPDLQARTSSNRVNGSSGQWGASSSNATSKGLSSKLGPLEPSVRLELLAPTPALKIGQQVRLRSTLDEKEGPVVVGRLAARLDAVAEVAEGTPDLQPLKDW